jgi:hypothetical protein
MIRATMRVVRAIASDEERKPLRGLRDPITPAKVRANGLLAGIVCINELLVQSDNALDALDMPIEFVGEYPEVIKAPWGIRLMADITKPLAVVGGPVEPWGFVEAPLTLINPVSPITEREAALVTIVQEVEDAL